MVTIQWSGAVAAAGIERAQDYSHTGNMGILVGSSLKGVTFASWRAFWRMMVFTLQLTSEDIHGGAIPRPMKLLPTVLATRWLRSCTTKRTSQRL